jgi:hypothetical protein
MYMDINNFANMKLSDFENIGKDQYNKGFAEALGTVVRLLANQICEDFNMDNTCEHEKCSTLYELSEGLEAVKRNLD